MSLVSCLRSQIKTLFTNILGKFESIDVVLFGEQHFLTVNCEHTTNKGSIRDRKCLKEKIDRFYLAGENILVLLLS